MKKIFTLLLVSFCYFSFIHAQYCQLDTSFGVMGSVTGDSTSYNNAVVIQPDGKILTAGGIKVGNTVFMNVARYMPNGALDSTFGINGQATPCNAAATSIIQQSDGKILLTCPIGVVRLMPSGSLDATFGSGGIAVGDTSRIKLGFLSAAVQTDGKIVLGSSGTYHGPYNYFSVTRLLSSGKIDSTFGYNGVRYIGGYQDTMAHLPDTLADQIRIALQSDGKIIIGGNWESYYDYSIYSNVQYNYSVFLARLLPDGSLDSSFATNGFIPPFFNNAYTIINAMTLTKDNKILLGGSNNTIVVQGVSIEATVLMQFDTTGHFDAGFGTAGVAPSPAFSGDSNSAYIVGLAIDTQQRIVAACYAWDSTYHSALGGYSFAMARYTSSGVLDTSFGPGGTDYLIRNNNTIWGDAMAIAIQPDNKIVLTGQSPEWWDEKSYTARYYSGGSSVINGVGAAIASDEITVYPNPSSGLVYIRMTNDITQINVYDLLGREVFSRTEENETQDRISIEAPGVYMIQFKTGSGTIMKKVVIDK